MITTNKKGKLAEEAFINRLQELKIPFDKFGREHRIKNKILIQLLNNDYSKTACHVRFSPDFFCYINEEFQFAEVKNSKTIEKHSFENYAFMDKIGVGILIFFFVQGEFYYCKPSEVPFCNHGTYEKHYKAGVIIPVVDNWVYPKKMNDKDFQTWKACTGGSGKPYASILISSIKKLRKL